MIAAMDISHIPLFQMLTQRMSWITQRQTVLAENVANANTPGYVAKDLKEPDFAALVERNNGSIQLAATQPGHIASRAGAGEFAAVATPEGTSLDGNGVSMEEQMMKISSNAADYALMTSLYKEHVTLIKTVLGGGGSGG